jgi:hypothetical protein
MFDPKCTECKRLYGEVAKAAAASSKIPPGLLTVDQVATWQAASGDTWKTWVSISAEYRAHINTHEEVCNG